MFGVDNDLVVSKLRTMQEWLLVAYAISLPLSMTASWVLFTAGMIAFVAGLVLSRRFDTPLPLKWPLAAVALAVALSGFHRDGLKDAWHCFWSLKALLVYFWASNTFAHRPLVAKWCAQWMLCVGAVAGLYGTIQQRFDYHPTAYKWLQGTGFLAGPMPFAGQMQIFSLLASALFLTGGYKTFTGKLSNKYVFAVITLLNLSGLVFALERSAWLGGVCGIMVLAGLISWRMFAKAVVVLSVCGLLGYMLVPDVKNRVKTAFSPTDPSTHSRLLIWSEAVNQWHKSPVFGVGFMSFPRLEIKEAIVEGQSKDLNHAHSNYLQFLATTGIVGVIAYAFLCLSILFTLSRAYGLARKDNDTLRMGLTGGTLAAMVSLMVSGLFEFNFGTAQVRLAQWMVLAFLAIRSTGEPVEHGPKPLSENLDTVPDSLPSV